MQQFGDYDDQQFQFQQKQQQGSLNCICGVSISLEMEEMVVTHMLSCHYYQSSSQLINQFPRIEKFGVNELLSLRAELKSIIIKINEELFNKGQGDAFEGNFEPIKQQPKRQISNDKQGIQCIECKKRYDQDMENICFLDSCCHQVCKPCINQQMNENFLRLNGQIKCPDQNCKFNLTQNDFICAVGEKIQQEFELKLLLKSQNITTCVICKKQFAFEKGDAKSIVKDAKGIQLKGDQLQAYIENRFICPGEGCKTEQCKECQAHPFHTGYTCEQYKQQLKKKKCRFCESSIDQIQQNKPKQIQEVCNQPDCLTRSQLVCLKTQPCGHNCLGFRDEGKCIPCLEATCIQKGLQQNADDYCNVCFTEALRAAPCVKSTCGHIFHVECITKRIETRWNGPRIVFNFCFCPLCKSWLEFPPDNKVLTKLMIDNKAIYEDVKTKAVERLKVEGRNKDKELSDPNHPYYRKELEYSMAIFAYYECFKCKKPYFGGLKSCQLNIDDERRQFDKSELVCPKCCPVSFDSDCKKHGKDYIEFKCRYCCSLALWFCWATTHFCEPCHKKAYEMKNKKPGDLAQCANPESCPLRIKHKQNGEECALGCGLCRQEALQK